MLRYTVMDILQQLVPVNDTRLYCERAGQGDALVLVHGGAGDRRYWDGQFPALAQQHDVIRYDLRGYGRSDDPVEGQAYRHEDDLQALLKALGIPRAHVAGYSLGSQIVVDAYTLYPQLFRSIIAVGPYVSGHASAAADALFGAYAECGRVFCRAGPRAAAEQFLSIPAFNPEQIDPLTRRELLAICGEYAWWWADHVDPLRRVSPNAIEVLDRIGVPLLIISAEHDAAVCREVAARLERSVAGSRRVDLAGATHFMLMEQPAGFNRVLLEFTRQPELPGAID